jgi:hypothetical protein
VARARKLEGGTIDERKIGVSVNSHGSVLQ